MISGSDEQPAAGLQVTKLDQRSPPLDDTGGHRRFLPSVAADGITAHRLLSLLATLSLSGIAFASLGSAVRLPVTGVLTTVVLGGGLLLAAAMFAAEDEPVLARLDVLLCLLALIALANQAVNALYLNPGYGTDEAAFEQAAANLLLHGHNPYGANLVSALSQFRVPIQYATSLLNGGIASTFGYPAVPILVAAVAVRVTGGTQAVPVAHVVILALVTLFAFRLFPRRWRAVVVLVCVGLPMLFTLAVSGLNEIICMALLVAVAYRWNDVGSSGRLTRKQGMQGVALGLAVSTQQLAWFVTPFLLIGIYLLRREHLDRRSARSVVARYFGCAAIAFLAVNLPFIIWSAHAWISGVMSPLTQKAIPYGSGVINFMLFLHAGGGDLSLYQDGALLLMAGLLALYVLNFRRLGLACFLLPVIPLFLSTRSLTGYFITLAAVIVTSVATVDIGEITGVRQRSLHVWGADRRGLINLACLAPAALCIAFALMTAQPLSIHITDLTTTGELGSIWQINAVVRNNSGHPLTPHFATNESGPATTFLNIASGPRKLAPHASASYVLYEANVSSMPGLTSQFALEAYTASPETFSSSSSLTPSPYVATLMPSYVNKVLPTGGQTTLTVQLQSAVGGDVRRAGVRVGIGQVIYAQAGLILSEARINGSQEGATPEYAYTNSAGRAAFHLTDDSPQGYPVYFQARVQPPGHYSFGYSELVSVLWR